MLIRELINEIATAGSQVQEVLQLWQVPPPHIKPKNVVNMVHPAPKKKNPDGTTKNVPY